MLYVLGHIKSILNPDEREGSIFQIWICACMLFYLQGPERCIGVYKPLSSSMIYSLRNHKHCPLNHKHYPLNHKHYSPNHNHLLITLCPAVYKASLYAAHHLTSCSTSNLQYMQPGQAVEVKIGESQTWHAAEWVEIHYGVAYGRGARQTVMLISPHFCIFD